LQQQKSDWLKAVAAHLRELESVLASKLGAERKGLEEIVPACERLRSSGRLEKADELLGQGRSGCLRLIGEEDPALAELEASLRALGTKAKSDAAWILRRYYLNRAKLTGLPDPVWAAEEAKQNLKSYLRLCRRAGDWEAEADGLGFLARICCALAEETAKQAKVKPEAAATAQEEALRMLQRHEALCRHHGDAARLAAAGLARVEFLLKLKREGDAVHAWRRLRKSNPSMLKAAELSCRIFLLEVLADLWPRNQRRRNRNTTGAAPHEAGGGGAKTNAIHEYIRFAMESRDLGTPAGSANAQLVAGMLVLFPENYWWQRRPGFARESETPLGSERSATDSADAPLAEKPLAEFPVEVITRFEARKDQFLREGNLEGVRICDLHLAKAHSIRGESQDAVKILVDRANVCRQIGDKRGLAECLEQQAEILESVKRGAEADRLLKYRDILLRELRLQKGLGYAFWNWGLLAAARGDPTGVPAYLIDAAAIFESLEMLEEQREAAGDLRRLRSAKR